MIDRFMSKGTARDGLREIRKRLVSGKIKFVSYLAMRQVYKKVLQSKEVQG